jgi:hypothetical protein
LNNPESLATNFLRFTIATFEGLKSNSEKAFNQLQPEEFNWQPDSESNSIAIIMQHLEGNMISRWTDFLTADGEKPDRNRDMEFIPHKSHQQLLVDWEKSWKLFLDVLKSLKPEDLEKTIYIRKQPLLVIDAIQRQLSHYSYHVGQIVFLCKMIRKEEWKTLSIPKGKSEEYNKGLIK